MFNVWHRPILTRLAQVLSAALLLLTPGGEAAQLPLAENEPPLQLVYPEGANPPPGETLNSFYTSCLDFGAIFDCHANDVFWVIISGTLVGVERSPVQASVEEVFTDVFCSNRSSFRCCNSKAKQLLLVHSNLQYNAVSQQSLWIILITTITIVGL